MRTACPRTSARNTTRLHRLRSDFHSIAELIILQLRRDVVEKGIGTHDNEALLRTREGDVRAIQVQDEACGRADRMRVALGSRDDYRGLLAALQTLDGVDEADIKPMLAERRAQQRALRPMRGDHCD